MQTGGEGVRQVDLEGETATAAWARFDPTETWRYELGRVWDRSRKRLAFIMLNPSTADAEVLDNTVTRCLGFADSWEEYGSLEVGNLFALRSTDPRALRKHPDPVGPDNDSALLGIAERAHLIVLAWGNLGSYKGRSDEVLGLLRPYLGKLYVLKLTKEGEPIHPLYVLGETKPSRYPIASLPEAVLAAIRNP